MSKKVIYTPYAPEPIGPYSQAIEINGVLYVSGQIPVQPTRNKLIDGGIEEQTRQVLENLKAILEAANYKFEQVAKCSIFISDMKNFGDMNAVYGSFFDGDYAPARECVEVSRLPKDAMIEISCIAVK